MELIAWANDTPKSLRLIPSIPIGGTALISPATFNCLASLRTNEFNTCTPALAALKIISAVATKLILSLSVLAHTPLSAHPKRRL